MRPRSNRPAKIDGLRWFRVGLFAKREHFPAMRKYFGDSIKATAEFSYISIGLVSVLILLMINRKLHVSCRMCNEFVEGALLTKLSVSSEPRS